MAEPKSTLLVLTAAFLLPYGLDAQMASRLDAGTLATGARSDAGLPSSVFRVAPSVSIARALGSVRGTTSTWLVGDQWLLADAALAGTLLSPSIYGVHMEVSGNASRAFDDRSLGADQIDVQTRVHIQLGRGGAWFGGGVARPWRVSAISSIDVTDVGAWTQMGGATFTGTFTSLSFSKVIDEDSIGAAQQCAGAAANHSTFVRADGGYLRLLGPALCHFQSRIQDVDGSFRVERRRLQLSGQVGYRFGNSADVTPDSRRWASATATIWVAPRMAIVAGGGRQPSIPARGIPSRTFAKLGMAVTYAVPRAQPVAADHAMVNVRSFEVHPEPDRPGVRKFTVRIRGVEKVDVMGDFTGWIPFRMIRRGRDLWELTVPLAAGYYSINIRVDGGAWMAPPGLPATADGFGGTVGKLIIER